MAKGWGNLPEKAPLLVRPGWSGAPVQRARLIRDGWFGRLLREGRSPALSAEGTLSVAIRMKLNMAAAFGASGTLSVSRKFPTFAPVTTTFTTTGASSYTVPYWADRIDIICLGAGGGGVGGGSTFIAGRGGRKGAFNSVGTVTPLTSTLSVQVGAGGAGGASGGVTGSASQAGGASWVRATGLDVTATGGAGESGPGTSTGEAPGSTNVNSVAYSGGAGGSQGNPGTVGGVGAGGGGGDGGLAVGRAGGAGGRGQVWIRAWQSGVGGGGAAAQLTGVVYSQSSLLSGNNAATYVNMNSNNANGSLNNNETGTNNGASEWIRADCGSVKLIDRIVLGYDYLTNLPGGWGVTYTETAAVQGSNDGTNWTDITITPTYAGSGSTNGLVTVAINQSWRYIRIAKLGYICTLEFQVWGS